MPDFVVVLVEPLIAGNIGSVARAMSNFGLERLVLLNPCALGDDAFRFAKHGRHVVENARLVDDLDAALEGLDLVVGTTGIPTHDRRKALRQAFTPRELAERLAGAEGVVGLVFGREDQGLSNDELARCDMVVSIPTHSGNPIMNLSHAAAVVFYELSVGTGPDERRNRTDRKLAGRTEVEAINTLFSELLTEIDYPEHKRPNTEVMFRKLLARSEMSSWEFHRLAGVIGRAVKVIRWEREHRG